MRLTNEIKDQLTQNLLLSSPLIEKARRVITQRQSLVEEIRQVLLKQYELTDEKIREIKKSITKTGFIALQVNEGKVLRATIAGQYRELSLNGLDTRYRHNGKHVGSHDLESQLIFGVKIAEYVCEKYVGVDRNYLTLNKPGKLYDRLVASDSVIDLLYDEVPAFRVQVKGALSRITTVNKLKEAWPDAVPFLPPVAKPQSTTLALPVDTLNAICGLPK